MNPIHEEWKATLREPQTPPPPLTPPSPSRRGHTLESEDEMKPFNLEAAKAGAPLVARDGRPAKFIAHVAEAHPSQRLLVLIDGAVHTKFENGKHASRPTHIYDSDLFMAPVKRTVWANFYGHGAARWHDTEKAADDCALSGRLGGRAWPIEVEA